MEKPALPSFTRPRNAGVDIATIFQCDSLFLHGVKSLCWTSSFEELEPQSIQHSHWNPENDLNSWMGPASLLASLGREPSRTLHVEPEPCPLLLPPFLDVDGAWAGSTLRTCTAVSSQQLFWSCPSSLPSSSLPGPISRPFFFA